MSDHWGYPGPRPGASGVRPSKRDAFRPLSQTASHPRDTPGDDSGSKEPPNPPPLSPAQAGIVPLGTHRLTSSQPGPRLRGDERKNRCDPQDRNCYRTITFRGAVELHDHGVAPETLELVRTAFERLSPSDREIIQLAAFDGLTGADLGAALGISPGAAAVRLHRARERFGEHYRKQDQP